MKKLFVLMLGLGLATSASLVSAKSPVSSLSTEMKSATYFEDAKINGVDAGSGFDVTLINSPQTKAVVDYPADYEDKLIVTLSKSGTIKVEIKGGKVSKYGKGRTPKITIYLPELVTINGSNGVVIHGAVFRSSKVSVSLSSGSKFLDLNLIAKNLKLSLDDECEMTFQAKLSGDATMSANKTSKITANVSADEIAITANKSSVVIAEIKCDNYSVNSLESSDVTLSGIGKAGKVVTKSGGTVNSRKLFNH